ncbi:DNA polymerase III subunit epsilon [Helicobacter sp. 12S02232-10]|uniref:3'-5' exonuclease n=1 Tax=Helicobacter sp. 12S02232-10 TaxID=1476197 RepID=UPI000BA5AA46|nr:3'-5' exonuclease [Helicobacter sp. 12S02232-10]PAF49462.1 DNA polymerase III subunit epsilon [Helicobacter sp. 12S02232-10]
MNYSELYDRLKVAPINKEEFLNRLANIEGLYADSETGLEILKSCGFPLRQEDENIILTTSKTKWKEQVFCFVDIETTGAKPDISSIIEIGALKYQGGQTIGKFESFVYAKEIPEKITELTGISAKTIQNAPKVSEVLRKFKEFLGESVFVAHNVNFDYGFISYHMDKIGLNQILNPKICTIDLARRTILSPRYSLGFLNLFLGINIPVSHRAYADALSASKVFEICLYSLPKRIISTQDLIDFSKGKKNF